MIFATEVFTPMVLVALPYIMAGDRSARVGPVPVQAQARVTNPGGIIDYA